MVQPAPRASVELDTAVAEAVPTCPASPTKAITISSGEEAEAGDATPGTTLLMVSNLLRAIPNTRKVVPSSGAGVAEEAGPSEPPRGSFKEIIIQPPLSRVVVTLFTPRADPSIWGGPTLTWMSIGG